MTPAVKLKSVPMCPVCGGPKGTGHTKDLLVDQICWDCWCAIPLPTIHRWHAGHIKTPRLIAVAKERIKSCRELDGGRSGARRKG